MVRRGSSSVMSPSGDPWNITTLLVGEPADPRAKRHPGRRAYLTTVGRAAEVHRLA